MRRGVGWGGAGLGSEVLLHRAVAGVAWGVTGGGRCHILPSFSECPFTVLLHDVMEFWDSFLQKVTGMPDTMGHGHSVTPQWRG